MKKLLVLLLLPLPAFALHVVSSDYPTTGDQPVSFTITCPTGTPFVSTALIDTNGTNTDGTAVKGGAYLSQDLTVISGAGSGVTCSVYATDALALVSTTVSFAIPAGPAAPAGITVTK